MTNSEKTIEILNDLIQINNDRVLGYERAINELKDEDADLRTVFQSYATHSSLHVVELTEEVIKLGGTPDDGTTNSGKIYRAWMDVKATFTGSDRLTVLSNCEFSEDAAQKAYKNAIGEHFELTDDARTLVLRQKAELQTAHDIIKEARDAEKIDS